MGMSYKGAVALFCGHLGYGTCKYGLKRLKKRFAGRPGKRAELRKKLVRALRSGQYLQGDGQLAIFDTKRGTVKFCCLGVACNIEAEASKTKGFDYPEPERGCDLVSLTYDSQEEYLPASTAKNFGLGTKVQHALASLNDRGCKFKTIAKVIENLLIP